MKKTWITIACLVAGMTCIAQNRTNLVFNPSFEDHTTCPERIDAVGIMREVEGWWQPTAGSSDYFNTCGGKESSVPRNKMGIQTPHSGNAYCGIYCSQENYREYLQTELKEPLKAGSRYHVSFHVSLAEKSPHAVATIGALLTADRIGDSLRGVLMERETQTDGLNGLAIVTYYTPQVENPQGNVINNSTEWVEISGDFTAQGGERFLTIGNFRSFNHSNVVDLNKSAAPLPGAYYYIDDVSLTCLDTDGPATAAAQDTLHEGDVIVMHNIYFEVGESALLPQSYRELALLMDVLNDHPTLHIEIRGHTDNTGTIGLNQKLSEARAQAVVDYLVQHGIGKERLQWRGFGKSQPIDSNATAEGRSHNRRVEYRITKL